jgi:hypothetical protein
MMTKIGEIPEWKLVKKIIKEVVPCGLSVSTEFYFNDEMVRRDVNIIVDMEKFPELKALTGSV